MGSIKFSPLPGTLAEARQVARTLDNARAGVGASLGGAGWRLPTIEELQTIVDKSQSSPAIDSTAFPTTPVNRFWSSSPVAGSPSRARLVDFCLGTTDTNDVSYMFNVRCVR